MKQLIAAILAMGMALSLTACGGAASSTVSSASSAAETSGAADSGTSAATKIEQIKAAGKLVVATSPDYAPFEFKDLSKEGQNQLVGADIELAKYIAEDLGVELQIEEMDFASLIAAVQANKADISISGFTYKEERAEQVGMAGPFYSEGKQGVMVRKDTYKTLAELEGKKIGAQNGTIQYDLAMENIKDPQIEVITTMNDGVMMLKTGKIDALAIAFSVAESFMNNYEGFEMMEETFDYNPGLYAICNKNETEFCDYLTETIQKVDNEGTYKQWVEENKALAATLGVE